MICYFLQKYDCDSLDVNDNDLRMEVVHMKELRHNNLLTFAGACLEWPNVCVLTEICPKVRSCEPRREKTCLCGFHPRQHKPGCSAEEDG